MFLLGKLWKFRWKFPVEPGLTLLIIVKKYKEGSENLYLVVGQSQILQDVVGHINFNSDTAGYSAPEVKKTTKIVEV